VRLVGFTSLERPGGPHRSELHPFGVPLVEFAVHVRGDIDVVDDQVADEPGQADVTPAPLPARWSAPCRTKSRRASRTAAHAWLTKQTRGSRQSRAPRSIPPTGWLTDDLFTRGTGGRLRTEAGAPKADIDRQPSSITATEREGCPSEGSTTFGGRL